ncbi:site-specific DNA-methyltransferase [Mycolicibacterium fortuitum]|uniref:site-specific DNA-methyltransferase n=1 Tax=Mycolicibacterium fortuitum TaxID=1766 RepID=UPI0007EAA903|nr:DNA methyltransferase [Mycolicibacterium fortuitum]OBB47107.1 DNA methyltransferase [Mycolicibacterium fortuitum]OBB70980.1 DNA methyltransferase [Mycolicibacterium fortuitum]OBF65966.1 DNA methyltransferase [Mycolicibacterium fortuitum]
MSRLSDLIRQAKAADSQLGADLEREFRALTKRRSFGLVFERHQPEAVELAGRPVRKGDKVHILPPRGSRSRGDQRLWAVTGFEGRGENRAAKLVEAGQVEESESMVALVADLVVVAEFRDHIYPGLIETGRVERGGDKPFHTVINAENFHALEMLTYTHRHAIDAIYIDPPYNSGAKDWKYNNDYVESDDDYRHSKWLAMMERRLLIARELLNPANSVLIVTIDEKEYLRLGLLVEQMFPEARIQMVSSVINPGGASRTAAFTRVDEYIFFVKIGSAAPAKHSNDMLFTDASEPDENRSPIWRGMLRGGSGPLRADSPSKFYPVLVDRKTGAVVGAGEPLPLSVDRATYKPPAGLDAVWPLKRGGVEGRWELNAATFEFRRSQGYVRAGDPNRRTGVRTIYYLRNAEMERLESGELISRGMNDRGFLDVDYNPERERTLPAKTVWNRQSHNATEYGSNLLKAILPNRKFPYPKSLYAVEDTLRFFINDKPDAIVLDFFSGSGTTAHAVMRLNKQDGGRRQCISVTNNEVSADEQTRLRREGLRAGDDRWESLGICDYITKPRITAAITGKTPEGAAISGDYRFTDEFPMADGFEENAAFFTLTYEGPLSVAHHRAFARVAPMLWLRAGARGPIITEIGDKGWDLTDVYGVLDDLDTASRFVAEVKKTPSVTMVYIVTDDDLAFQMVCRELPKDVQPVQLYESYLRNFEINSGRFA